MPGNIVTTTPTIVLPAALCSAFSLDVERPANIAAYVNGEYQGVAITDASRRTWSQTRRLTPALSNALQAFYLTRGGPAHPFFFYDPMETTGFLVDATGASLTGRYIVRFDGPFAQSWQLGRLANTFRLIETR